MTTTSDQLFGCGSHFTDILFTSGGYGTPSIVNAFTTFLLLSFSKILFVSFSLIYHIHIEHSNVWIWDSKSSIVNAFATFLLLSFAKILFVSFSLFYTTNISYSNASLPNKCVLYYDPTVECYTPEHFIFLAIVVFVLLLFIIFSTVLLILLCRCLWNHFRDSTKMEPMVLMTSGLFQHHFSSSG